MIYRNGTLGSGLLYFIYFLMMALILAGIYGGLIAYFGSGYDSRIGESKLLLKETRECFDTEKFDLAKLNKEMFFDKCGFSSKVLEDGEHLVYIRDKNGKEFSVGVTDYKNRCFLNARVKNKDFPLCAKHEPMKGTDGNYFLVGSSQNSRRVAV